MREVDPSLRVALRKAIEADYGEHTIMPANQMPKVKRLASRSLGIDYVTGGGYPFGNMTRLWGGMGGGKTTLIYNAFWSAQHFDELRFARLNYLADLAQVSGLSKDSKRLREQAKYEQERYHGGLKVMYVCAEKRFDPKQPEALGVDLSEEKFEIVLTTRIEEIGDIVQKALQAYHVIAVDSTTGTISLNELGHKDGIMANLSIQRVKMWALVMDWWRDRMSPENVLIFTSHANSVIGASSFQRAALEQAPGGAKLWHEPSVVLHLVKGKKLKYKTTKDGGLGEIGEEGGVKGAFGKAQPDGAELVVICEKNSTAKDRRIALLNFDKATANFDLIHDYVKLGAYFKVIVHSSGGNYTLPDGSKTNQIRKRIIKDEVLRQQIEEVVYHCAEDAAFEKRLLEGRGGPGEAMVPDFEAVA